MPSTRSATRLWFCELSLPMTPHCSAVDSSMRVNVVAMSRSSQKSGEGSQHGAGRHRSVVQHPSVRDRTAEGERRDQVDGSEQLAQLAWRGEVLLFRRDADLFD